MHNNKWEDSLLGCKQSCVTSQHPSPLFLKHAEESDQIFTKKNAYRTFLPDSMTVNISTFIKLTYFSWNISAHIIDLRLELKLSLNCKF